MADSTSFGLADWLQLTAILAGIQVVGISLRNFRSGSRLIPIGSVTPEIVKQHNTIPLRFVGSDSSFTQRILRLYGRMWIGRKAIKQPFLCDEILLMSNNGDRLGRRTELQPGDQVRVRLSLGESTSHAYQSAKRSAGGSELQLILVYPSANHDSFEENIRSIYVYPRARNVMDDEGRSIDQELEWPIVEPSILGAKTDSVVTWSEVGTSALWLLSKHQYGESVPQYSEIDGSFAEKLKFINSFGSNRIKGFLSLCITGIAHAVAILILALIFFDQGGYTPLRLLSIAISGVWVFHWIGTGKPRRFAIESPRVRKSKGRPTLFGRDYEEDKLMWYGSTKRSLAIGDVIRKAELWRQLQYEYLEPNVLKLKGWWNYHKAQAQLHWQKVINRMSRK